MLEKLIYIFSQDRHSLYLLSAYGLFFVSIFWLIFYGYFQHSSLAKRILKIAAIEKKSQSQAIQNSVNPVNPNES